jgi:hypothetical protein
VADLSVLLDAGEGGDAVETDGGAWIGSVIPMRGPGGSSMIRAIRTWHC